MRQIIGKKARRFWFVFSGVITLFSLIFIFTVGIRQGIEYTGGTAIEFSLDKKITSNTVQKAIEQSAVLKKMHLKEQIQPFSSVTAHGTQVFGMIVKTRSLTTQETEMVVNELGKALSPEYGKLFHLENVTYYNIEATIGRELVNKAILAILLSTLGILIYVSFRFEFKSGVSAVIALIHDVIVVLGVAAVFRIEVNGPFLAAILTVVGYSINDTIVVFDRIRESLKFRKKGELFEDLVNNAIWTVLRRCIFTVLTTMISIIPLYFFVPTIREFTLPMLIGVASGAYSSIFVASAIWIVWRNRSERVSQQQQILAKKTKA